MPDRVELLGEEELMPGKTWLVYRNLRTGQLSKVPKEIMDNPRTGPLMMNHLTGYATTGGPTSGGVAAQHADPSAEFRVQEIQHDMRRMAPNSARPWEPPGHDYAPIGGGREAQVPQTPMEVLRLLREQFNPQPQKPHAKARAADPSGRGMTASDA